MKLFIKLVMFLFSSAIVFGQSEESQLESLHKYLKNAENDTIRMDVYNQLGTYYLEINFDSSLTYTNQAITLSKKIRAKLGEAIALLQQGYSFYHLGNYPKSLESYLQALKIAEDPESENYTIPYKGITLRNQRLNVLGYIYLNMGHLYGSTGDTEKLLTNYFKTISLAESIQDSVLVSLGYMSLGSQYFDLNKLDSALLFSQKALQFDPGGKYSGSNFINIGNIYRQKGNNNQALIYYQRALQVNTEQNNLTSFGDNIIVLSELFEIMYKLDSSLFYARKGLENAKILRQPYQFSQVYKRLSEIYNSTQNQDSTLKYLKLYAALNDSLNNVEKENLRAYQKIGFEEQIRLQILEEEKVQMQTRIRINTLIGGLFTLIVIAFILFRNNRQKQRAKQKIEDAYNQLKSTQAQLIQSEKMASLGELTAGIAHEIQNPLNFVNNFSEVSSELVHELKEELDKGDINEAKAISDDVIQNLEKIHHHGNRASSIVKGMLEHSRTSSGKKELTDINALADEYLRLSYHGLRAKDKSFNAEMVTDFDPNLPKFEVIPQDIGRVLLNLINNAFQATSEEALKRKLNSSENEAKSDSYKPTVTVSTKYKALSPMERAGGEVEITIKDNGPGIPDEIKDKIFQPFFTTKDTGKGTGLGLSLAYDIVKAHGWELSMQTELSKGTDFIILLPLK